MWYKDGLHFQCTGCGDCCTGAPGFVWITPAELSQMAKALGISDERFEREYTRTIAGVRTSLNEYPNGDCYFFDSATRRCQIYDVRPAQCRTWPFWDSNLGSRKDWKEAAQRCPGCNNGPLIPLEEIEKRRKEVNV